MTSRFSVVKVGPPIEVFAVNKAYLDDTSDLKVNLSVGGKVM
jgi:aspartate aminotransferase